MRSMLLVVAALVGCGGNVVFEEPDGSGGAASTTGFSTASTDVATSVTTGPSDCAALEAELNARVTAAVACSPTLAVVQCSGAATVPGLCCPVFANETQPDLIQAAKDAHDAWANAGCVAENCPFSCPFSDQGACQPGPDGRSGFCSMLFPD